MTLEELAFDRVLEHCVKITSSVDLQEVLDASVAAVADLLDGARAALELEATAPDLRNEGSGREEADSQVQIPLSVGELVIGVLSVYSARPDAFGESQRAILLSLAPAVASAVNNALIVERERTAWRKQRDLEAQKRLFVSRAAADLRGPIAELRSFLDAIDGSDPDAVREMHLRARALARVVEQILDTSVPEGRVEPEPGRV